MEVVLRAVHSLHRGDTGLQSCNFIRDGDRDKIMIKIAICDDEEYFRNTIKDSVLQYMIRYGIPYEINMFESGSKLIKLGVGIIPYTIVFLDINMDKIDGIKTAQKIREYSEEVFIVFVTAYINYTLEGYKVDAVRYILKSNNNFNDTIAECLDTIIKKLNYTVVKKEFKFNEGRRAIFLNRLLYIESRLHKLEFHVIEDHIKILTLYDILDNMENELKDYGFVRIHQSFLVNMKHIKSVTRYEALLQNGSRLSIPKARYTGVKDSFVAYKGEL